MNTAHVKMDQASDKLKWKLRKKEERIKEVMFWVEDWTHHPYIGQSFSPPNAPTLLHSYQITTFLVFNELWLWLVMISTIRSKLLIFFSKIFGPNKVNNVYEKVN